MTTASVIILEPRRSLQCLSFTVLQLKPEGSPAPPTKFTSTTKKNQKTIQSESHFALTMHQRNNHEIRDSLRTKLNQKCATHD